MPPLNDTLKWLAGQLTLGQFYTPESFRGYGVGTPNESLWTITVEVQFYVAAAISYPVLSKLRTGQWLTLIAAGCTLSVANYYASPFIPSLAHKLIDVTLLPYAYVFLIGSWLYFTREQTLLPLAKHIVALFVMYVASRVFILASGITVPGTYRDMIIGLFVPAIAIGVTYACGRR